MIKVVKAITFPSLLLIMFFLNSESNYLNDYIIIAIYLGYLCFLFIEEKDYLMRYIYFIFYITTNIIGVFLIETGDIYLSELNIFSYKSNSLLLVVFAQILFMECIRLFDIRDKKLSNLNNVDNSFIIVGKNKVNKIKIIEILLILVFLVYLILFIKVIDKPFFLVKLDRFLYKEQYLSNIEDKIVNLFLYLTPLISMYYYKTRNNKVLLLVGLVALYLFWIGHKFSFFINIAYIIFMPLLWYGSKRILDKILKKGLLMIMLLILIVSLQSSVVYNRDFDGNIEYLKMRLAQQGQLWWATYDSVKNEENKINELDDEFKTYFKNNLETNEIFNSGIYKIMQLTTPYDIFIRKVEDKNSRYAYSTQASIYYYFKTPGLLIFSLLSAIALYIISKNLIRHIISMNIIASILYARLWIIFGRVLMQSDFDKLFSIQVLFIICLLAILKLVEITSVRRFNNHEGSIRLTI